MKPQIKYRTIRSNKYGYSIAYLCKFFGVSRSGYYKWLKRQDMPDKDLILREYIGECQRKCHKTYGYRRVRLWLEREKGLIVNKKAILRVMQKYNLLAEIRRPRGYFKSHPYRYVSYGNLLQRDFQAAHPNEKWVTDISYIQTKQGRLYLSVIKDLYDKSIIAYEMSQHLDNSLVVRTVSKAKRKIRKGTIIHSDQGSQYASGDYAELSKEFGFRPSMSRPATPIDNAPMESFFGILKQNVYTGTNLKQYSRQKSG